MIPDILNGTFELIGSLLTWLNVYRVYRDQGYAGLHPAAVVFFWSWGGWNLYYYPHLHQWWSFAGGLSLVVANTSWIGMMRWYGRKT